MNNEIIKLQKKVIQLEDLLLALIDKVNNDKFYSDADTAGVRQSVGEITPWKETKIAYIGDREIVFCDTPTNGNVTVFFDHSYTMERMHDRIIITFEPLEEVTDITISIL